MKNPEFVLRQDRPTEGIEETIAQFGYPSVAAMGRPWPAIAGLLTTLTAGILVIRLGVSTAEASPLDRVIRAERNAVRCVVRFYGEDGKIWGQGWQEGAKNRFDLRPGEAFGFTHATNGHRFWSIDRTSRVAFIETDDSWALAQLDNKVANIKGDRIRSEEKPDGTTEIVIERKPSSSSYLQRDTIIADSKDRPISISHDFFKSGKWVHSSRELREYDSPISPRTFEFKPASGYEVYAIDANRSKILEGLRSGIEKKVSGGKIRLAGVLQHRKGVLTAVYMGGATPLPDAIASVVVDGKTYSGKALVGNAVDPRGNRSRGNGVFRWPGQIVKGKRGIVVAATPEPYLELEGRPVRIIQFRVERLKGNTSKHVRVTLPSVIEGRERLVDGVRGRGVAKGTATFDVQTIPSIDGEEIFRLRSAKRAVYEIPLRLR